MKTIPLTKGMVALVDDADYEFVNQWKWCAHCCDGFFYAARNVRLDGKNKTLHMHRLLAGAIPGQQVDHADRCTLNNQRSNLRLCEPSQNHANSGKSKGKTSIFKGVCWVAGRHKWRASTKQNGKSKYIGYFNDPINAAKAYDSELEKRFGEFALTNQKLGLLASN